MEGCGIDKIHRDNMYPNQLGVYLIGWLNLDNGCMEIRMEGYANKVPFGIAMDWNM